MAICISEKLNINGAFKKNVICKIILPTKGTALKIFIINPKKALKRKYAIEMNIDWKMWYFK